LQEYVEEQEGGRDEFMIPIVGGLSSAIIETLLPRFIALGPETIEEVIK